MKKAKTTPSDKLPNA